MSHESSPLGAEAMTSHAQGASAQKTGDGKRQLPKKFYKTASWREADGAFHILLDERAVRTPAKNLVLAPTPALAQRLVAEWSQQVEVIDPAAMPLTRLVNTAIDGVVAHMAEVEDETARYAGSDLICYRADGPEKLVALQACAWDPVLRFLREKLQARLVLAEGVMFVDQPAEALNACLAALRACVGAGPKAPFRLTALHEIAALTGSLGLALALAHHALGADAVWSAANIDEDFQISTWGEDVEAQARRRRRFADYQAAAFLLDCTDE